MSYEEMGPRVLEQALVLESYRRGTQFQLCCLLSIHEATGQATHVPNFLISKLLISSPSFLISKMKVINPGHPQL